MAILHGLAGQHAKGEAKRLSKRVYMILSMSGLWTAATFGGAYGFLWARYGVPAAVSGAMCLLLLLFATMYLLERRISRYFDSIARERIKYMRGGQVEGYVGYLLKKELDDEWHVFNGIKLECESDTDHVVVGPGGVFCISTKSKRGWFVGQPKGLKLGLLHNHQPCDFAVQAQRQAMNLRDRLGAIMGADVPYVTPLLAVPFGYVDSDAMSGQVIVAHAEDLTDRIAPVDVPRKQSADMIARTVKAMEMIQSGAAAAYRRPVD
jgi:hypothetical protein